MKPTRERNLDLEGASAGKAARGMRFALVVSRFNHEVTDRLLEAAVECLVRHGSAAEDRTVVHVPGAWELQLAAQRLAVSGRHDAVIALGALIRGETSHFDVLAHQVAQGLAQVGLTTSLPVIFGVLTTETLEQALARAGDRAANKGWEAALSAIEMVGLCRRLA